MMAEQADPHTPGMIVVNTWQGGSSYLDIPITVEIASRYFREAPGIEVGSSSELGPHIWSPAAQSVRLSQLSAATDREIVIVFFLRGSRLSMTTIADQWEVTYSVPCT